MSKNNLQDIDPQLEQCHLVEATAANHGTLVGCNTGDMLKFSETQNLQNRLKQCHILL